jgi:nitroimidazol reductase NimA-like FMN-containing flavoprotein (pyridoxamine 5'-phosphate oxidase superfamily)
MLDTEHAPRPIRNTLDVPSFRTLERHEIEAMLQRNHVGRIAFSFKDRVDIEPIHYVFSNGWLYGRTSKGTKLSVITHHQWVAFEVDEVAGFFDWRSVVIKGHFEIIPADLTDAHAPAYTQAIALLQRLTPDALTPNDRVAFRNVLFRIHVTELSGREATPAASSIR